MELDIEDRDLAEMLGLSRIVLGGATMLAPRRVTRAWTGEHAREAVSLMAVRGLGARDLAIGVGILVALDRNTPVRGWLEASAIADFTDAFGTVSSWRRLPRWRRLGLLALEVGAGIVALRTAEALD